MTWAIVPFGFRVLITILLFYMQDAVWVSGKLTDNIHTNDTEEKKERKEKWLWVAFIAITIVFIFGLARTIQYLIAPEIIG